MPKLLKHLLYLLLLAPGLAAAQVAQAFTFTLQGQLDPRLNAPAKVYLSFNGWYDSATVTNGRFVLQGRVDKTYFTRPGQPPAPGRGFLLLSRRGQGAARAFDDIYTQLGKADNQQRQKFDFASSFYVEPGTITFHSLDSLKNAQVSGPRLTTEWQALVKAMQPYPIHIQSVDALHKPILVRFVAAHPASLVSVDEVASLVAIKNDSGLVRQLFGLLSPGLRHSSTGQQIAQQFSAWQHPLAIGQRAPYFKLPSTMGDSVSLFPFENRWVLLNFYTSTSAASQAESAELALLQKRCRGFIVYTIVVDGPAAQAAWLSAGPQPPPGVVLFDQPGPRSVASRYQVATTPQNLLLDSHGLIDAKDLHGQALQARLAQVLKPGPQGK